MRTSSLIFWSCCLKASISLHARLSLLSPSPFIFPFFLLPPTGTTPRRISGGANETTVPKLRLESPTAISLFSLWDGPMGHAEWSSSRASSKDSHQNKGSGRRWWWWFVGRAASLDEKCGHKESEVASSVVVQVRVGVPTLTTAGGGLIRWLLLAAWFCALPPVYWL